MDKHTSLLAKYINDILQSFIDSIPQGAKQSLKKIIIG